MSWIIDTLWWSWKLDQLPEDEAKQGDSFPRQEESVFQYVPAEPQCLDWAVLGHAMPDQC